MKKYLFFVVSVFLSACGGDSETFQGYVEGEYSYLASSRAGRLEKLYVSKGENIKKDELLFKLENDPEEFALLEAEQNRLRVLAQLNDMRLGKRPEEIAMAKAMLNQAKAEARNAGVLLKRNEELAQKGAISKQDLDDLRTAAKASNEKVAELASQVEVYQLPEREKRIEAQEALLKLAEAEVSQRTWELAQKKVSAPADGLVYDTLYKEGEWVQAGKPVIWFLLENELKIRFFVPETVLSSLHLGQNVYVYADGRTKAYSALINYISPQAEYTPPVIYSNETRSKLVYMIEAKPIAENVRETLHPGQPVSVRLYE